MLHKVSHYKVFPFLFFNQSTEKIAALSHKRPTVRGGDAKEYFETITGPVTHNDWQSGQSGQTHALAFPNTSVRVCATVC